MVYESGNRRPCRWRLFLLVHERCCLNAIRNLFIRQLALLTFLVFCIQGFLFLPHATAQSVSDQVSELLRQQLEAWNPPPPEVIPTPPPNTGEPVPPSTGEIPPNGT